MAIGWPYEIRVRPHWGSDEIARNLAGLLLMAHRVLVSVGQRGCPDSRNDGQGLSARLGRTGRHIEMVEQPVEEVRGLGAEESLCGRRAVSALDKIVVHRGECLQTGRGDAVQAVMPE